MSKLTVDFTPAELRVVTLITKLVFESGTRSPAWSFANLGSAVSKLDALEQAEETAARAFMVRVDEPRGIAACASLVRSLAEADSSYRPFCLRCDRLRRMAIRAPMLWECNACGAIHDERTDAEKGVKRG